MCRISPICGDWTPAYPTLHSFLYSFLLIICCLSLRLDSHLHVLHIHSFHSFKPICRVPFRLDTHYTLLLSNLLSSPPLLHCSLDLILFLAILSFYLSFVTQHTIFISQNLTVFNLTTVKVSWNAFHRHKMAS